MNMTGDEEHYLIKCNNEEMVAFRGSFLEEIKIKNPQLANFSTECIMAYCMSMSDDNIHMPTALYVRNILQTYKKQKEQEDRNTNTPSPKITKYGRKIKKPNRLDL